MEQNKQETKKQDVNVESSIYRKLHSIMNTVNYIQKEEQKVNNQYRPLSYARVLSNIRPLLLREKLLLIPGAIKNFNSYAVKDNKDTSKDKGFRTDITMSFVLFDLDSKEHFAFESSGSGFDTLDKDAGKAVTTAKKYALLNLFLLETGDGEESLYSANIPSDEDIEKSKLGKSDDYAKIKELADKCRIKPEIIAKAYGVDNIELIPGDKIKECTDRLIATIAKNTPVKQ